MCVRARFSERACISLCHAVVLSLFSMPCRLSVRAYVVCAASGCVPPCDKCGYDAELGQMVTLQDGQHEGKSRAYETHRCVCMCVCVCVRTSMQSYRYTNRPFIQPAFTIACKMTKPYKAPVPTYAHARTHSHIATHACAPLPPPTDTETTCAPTPTLAPIQTLARAPNLDTHAPMHSHTDT